MVVDEFAKLVTPGGAIWTRLCPGFTLSASLNGLIFSIHTHPPLASRFDIPPSCPLDRYEERSSIDSRVKYPDNFLDEFRLLSSSYCDALFNRLHLYLRPVLLSPAWFIHARPQSAYFQKQSAD